MHSSHFVRSLRLCVKESLRATAILPWLKRDSYFQGMEQSPKVTINVSLFDRVLEIIGWTLLIGLLLLAGYAYSTLPDTIPLHFDAQGRPDGYGNKSRIFVLPAIAIVLFIGTTYLIRSPHDFGKFNVPLKITESNLKRQYTFASRMIRVIKLVVVIEFIAITTVIFLVALGSIEAPGIWFIISTVGVVIVPVAFYLWKALDAG